MKISLYIGKNSIYQCYSSLRHSFTLIELSIALSVMGVLSAVGLSAYKASNPELKKDLKKIKAIEGKLQEFFNTNGRLPFPANPAENISNANYLTEAIYRNAYNSTSERYMCSSQTIMTNGSSVFSGTCSSGSTHCCPGNFVVWGIVPTRTLGLPDDYAYDSQGQNFEFITHSALAFKINDPFNEAYYKKDYQTSNDGKYDVLFQASGKADRKIVLERLSIYNNKTNKQIPTTTNNTAYVIMSKGKTNKCFFNTRASTSVNSTNPTGNLLKNCVSNYTNNSTTERTIYQGYSKDFDNIVKYKTLNELIYAKANAEEVKNEMTQGKIISYQPRDDTHLQTDSKNLIGAINELKSQIDILITENSSLKTRLNLIQSANNTSTLYLLGATSQTAQPTTYSQSNVYMNNGTLYLTKTTDLSGTANNKPALIIGGTDTAGHIEIDSNEIQVKTNGTTTGTLYLNTDGGDTILSQAGGNTHLSAKGHTYVGENITDSNLYVGKSGGSSKIYLNGKELKLEDTLTQQQICEYVYPVGSIYMNYSKTDNPNTLLGCGTWELVPRDLYLRSADSAGATNFFNNSTVSIGSYMYYAALPNITGVGHYADNNNEFSGALYKVKDGNMIGDGGSSGTLLGLDASKSDTTYSNKAIRSVFYHASGELWRPSGISGEAYCKTYCENRGMSYQGWDDWAANRNYFNATDMTDNTECFCKHKTTPMSTGYVQTASFNILIWKRTA